MNLDFGILRIKSDKILEIYQLKDRVLFLGEVDFGVINFYRSRMHGIFIYVITS